MEPFQNPHSKEAQLARSPGNRKKQSSKEKGAGFEKKVQAEFQKDSTKKVRRNFQGGPGGGLGNCDIEAMPNWHWESKNEKRITMPAYHRQIKEDCPEKHKPGLIYASPLDGTPWVSFPLELKMEFACDLIELAGGTVEFSYLSDLA